MPVRPSLALLATALLLVACSGLPTPFGQVEDTPPPGAVVVRADQLSLHVRNGTTLAVDIAVNGQPIATVRPMEGAEWLAPRLPALPWMVEARTVGGRLLTSMTVRGDDVWTIAAPDRVGFGGPFARVDLSCGRLDLWVGMFQPNGPAPGPGSPGDCLL